ncbi:MAG TPA: hypothetical protein EYG94_07565 [Campylobacterales bacterium]|nr:hypothetical protein [Campylobacterales bacterium]
MYKRVLALTFLLLLNTSISAMDLNETTIIINEAAEATEVLQNEFHSLVSETPIQKEIEVTEKIFEFKNIDKNSSISELNSSKKSSCNENNQSLIINGLTINLDQNNTITDNGCTDSNLGTSAEGLTIFKTRIKPYCKINGDKFAKQYMQEDWDDIYHDKEFKMEIIKACPKMEKRYRDEWTPHLYQFSIKYASDSDAIPEC